MTRADLRDRIADLVRFHRHSTYSSESVADAVLALIADGAEDRVTTTFKEDDPSIVVERRDVTLAVNAVLGEPS